MKRTKKAEAEVLRLRKILDAIHQECEVPDGGPTGDDIEDVWPSLIKIHALSKPTQPKKGQTP